ncbi:MAG TPA: hypothetical protein VF787_21955, partial [Thermoanaerobaculia bacterium]
SGDGYHASSTASVQVTVGRVPTTLIVTNTAAHYCVGSPVRLNADVFPHGQGEVEPPSDTLIFRNGNVVLNAVRHPEDGYRYHLTGLAPGLYALVVEFPGDENYEAATSYVSFVVDAPITPQISAGSGAFANSDENYASVAPAGPEFTCVWSVTNGAIVSGQGTPIIRYSAGASGSVTLSVVVSRDACTSSTEVMIPIHARAVGASMLYLVTPCRAVDTRESTIVVKNSTKDFALAGRCGIPADAQSVAANITVVQPDIPGWIAIYPRGSVWGGNSTLNYDSFVVRANNAILRLGTNGEVTVRNSESNLDLLIDVYGYFK